MLLTWKFNLGDDWALESTLLTLTNLKRTYEGGAQNTTKFVYKELCIYSYMFKLQSPSALDAIYLWRLFSLNRKEFLNSSILMPFSVSVVFCFTSSTAKCFPLRSFFIQGKKKKSLRVRLSEQGEWDMGVMPFLVKNC